ncbi:putative histidine phosphatase clade-1 [Rosellinia necatrix]|uniref:Putative histidine phosphatase clade-1 n=1 Tax=Rosellinia necatrix TaxID=77044 RepID=A0A1W2TTV5_ROSNE|nr:putative histidine phosphatase clade-1 [Rosellinia necatrix]
MSDRDATTPRVFLCRHGETEWTINGRHTGITELDLTANGVNQVRGSGALLVGPGKLIDPATVTQVFVSPRKRAQTTYGLLFGGDVFHSQVPAEKVMLTDEIAEWNYGDYEGLVTSEIQARRRANGLDSDSHWDIWRDGCEGGESPQDVTDRLDHLITEINDIHRPCMHGEAPADVVLVAHGHILRAFVKRWLRIPMANHFSIMMPPGAIGILSYEDHMIDRPALVVGLAPPSEKPL